MSDCDALFAAILANPDEDTPRLIYADWLEEYTDHPDTIKRPMSFTDLGRESGAKYAAFIRKQIELARVPEWDPIRLRSRYLEPETTRDSHWALPKLPTAVTWPGSPFRRGFPAAVETRDIPGLAATATDLFRIAPIEELDVGSPRGRNGLAALDVGPLIDNPWFTRIRRLKFSLSRLNMERAYQLLSSPHATHLIELDVLTGFAEGGNPVPFFRPPLITQLERLAVHVPTVFTSAILDAIRVNPGPRRLRSLRLTSGNNHTFPALLEEPSFYTASFCRSVTELDLSHNLLTGRALGTLLYSPVLEQLKSLKLNWSRMGDEAQALVQSPTLARLRLLDLSQNDLDAKTIQALAKSAHFANLRVLNLEKNPIGNGGAIAIAKSPHLTNLLDLNLASCDVGDSGAQAFLDSPLANSLIRLNLYSPDKQISPAIKRALRKQLGNRVHV